jgi:hypothetical protein
MKHTTPLSFFSVTLFIFIVATSLIGCSTQPDSTSSDILDESTPPLPTELPPVPSQDSSTQPQSSLPDDYSAPQSSEQSTVSEQSSVQSYLNYSYKSVIGKTTTFSSKTYVNVIQVSDTQFVSSLSQPGSSLVVYTPYYNQTYLYNASLSCADTVRLATYRSYYALNGSTVCFSPPRDLPIAQTIVLQLRTITQLVEGTIRTPSYLAGMSVSLLSP